MSTEGLQQSGPEMLRTTQMLVQGRGRVVTVTSHSQGGWDWSNSSQALILISICPLLFFLIGGQRLRSLISFWGSEWLAFEEYSGGLSGMFCFTQTTLFVVFIQLVPASLRTVG